MEKRESIVAVLCVFKYVGTDLRGIFTLFCQKEKKKKLKSANPLLPYFVSLSTSARAKMLNGKKKVIPWMLEVSAKHRNHSAARAKKSVLAQSNWTIVPEACRSRAKNIQVQKMSY